MTRHRSQLALLLLSLCCLLGVGPCGDGGDPGPGPGDTPDGGGPGPGDAGPRGDGGGAPGTGCAAATTGFCWENPWPQGSTLNAVWAVDAVHYYAVGDHGAVLRYDGSAFVPLQTGISDRATLRGVWGSSDTDVWFVGAGPGGALVLHYDGHAAADVTPAGAPPNLQAVWGSGPADVYVAGQGIGAMNAAMHWDGKAWTQPRQFPPCNGAVTGLWGSGPDKIVGTGPRTDFGCSNGACSATCNTLDWGNGVGGSAADDIWIVGGDSTGSTFFRQVGRTLPAFNAVRGPGLRSVWASGHDDAWAVGPGSSIEAMAHWNGSTWSWQNPAFYAGLMGIHGASARDAWSVGQAGLMLHLTGAGWSQYSRGPTVQLTGAWAAGPGEAWAVGTGGTVLHRSGGAWAQVSSGTTKDLYRVFGTGPRNVYFSGQVTLHGDGAAISDTGLGPSGDLFGTGDKDIWAAVTGGVAHFDGTRWTKTTLGTYTVFQLWASAPNDVWAAAGTSVLHFDGTRWLNAYMDTGLHEGVWGSGPADVWFASSPGTPPLHWDGSRFTPGTGETGAPLRGTSASDIWGVGTHRANSNDLGPGFLSHYDGTAWTVRELDLTLYDVTAASPAAVWAVGEAGAIVHRAP